MNAIMGHHTAHMVCIAPHPPRFQLGSYWDEDIVVADSCPQGSVCEDVDPNSTGVS